ncbi:MAG: hypothetical protein R3D55_17995 [Chloroflexota bacterium]
MSEQITITVSSKVYRRILAQAEQSRTNVSDLLNGVVANAFVSDASAETPHKKKCYARLRHTKRCTLLVKQFAGQFVAIHNGQVVDHDADKDALFFRVKQNFPNEIVLQRQVLENPDPVLHFRSPRFQQL